MHRDPGYTAKPARYAKGMMALHCESDGSGFKTRAMRIASALNARWSNRERAYIISPSKLAKFEAIFAAERDVDLCTTRDGKLGYVI